jgi:DNA-binding PadR family transcriptional regulator
MPRRVPGTLLPLEYRILEIGLELQNADGEFYGFALAKNLADDAGSSALIGHGTLYKALSRMTERGLLTAEWEDPDVAAAQNRPRRRFYRVSGEGEVALAARPAEPTVLPRPVKTAIA